MLQMLAGDQGELNSVFRCATDFLSDCGFSHCSSRPILFVAASSSGLKTVYVSGQGHCIYANFVTVT